MHRAIVPFAVATPAANTSTRILGPSDKRVGIVWGVVSTGARIQSGVDVTTTSGVRLSTSLPFTMNEDDYGCALKAAFYAMTLGGADTVCGWEILEYDKPQKG